MADPVKGLLAMMPAKADAPTDPEREARLAAMDAFMEALKDGDREAALDAFDKVDDDDVAEEG